MKSYRFDVFCPGCGGDLTHVATGAVVAGTFASVVAGCPECRREVQYTVTMRPVQTMAASRQRRHREVARV